MGEEIVRPRIKGGTISSASLIDCNIDDLSVSKLTCDECYSRDIYATDIKTTNIISGTSTTDMLIADEANVQTLHVRNIDLETLSAQRITSEELIVTNSTVTTGTYSECDITTLGSTTINSDYIESLELVSDKITVMNGGTVTLDKATIDTIFGDTIDASSINTDDATSKTVTSTQGNFTNCDVVTLTSESTSSINMEVDETITAKNIIASELLTSVNIRALDKMTADTLDVRSVSVTENVKANVLSVTTSVTASDLIADRIVVDDIEAQTGEIADLTVTNLAVSTLSQLSDINADTLQIDTITTSDIVSDTGKITTLVGTTATIDTINVSDLNVENNVVFKDVSMSNLTVVTINTNDLDVSDTLNVKDVNVGNALIANDISARDLSARTLDATADITTTQDVFCRDVSSSRRGTFKRIECDDVLGKGITTDEMDVTDELRTKNISVSGSLSVQDLSVRDLSANTIVTTGNITTPAKLYCRDISSSRYGTFADIEANTSSCNDLDVVNKIVTKDLRVTGEINAVGESTFGSAFVDFAIIKNLVVTNEINVLGVRTLTANTLNVTTLNGDKVNGNTFTTKNLSCDRAWANQDLSCYRGCHAAFFDNIIPVMSQSSRKVGIPRPITEYMYEPDENDMRYAGLYSSETSTYFILMTSDDWTFESVAAKSMMHTLPFIIVTDGEHTHAIDSELYLVEYNSDQRTLTTIRAIRHSAKWCPLHVNKDKYSSGKYAIAVESPSQIPHPENMFTPTRADLHATMRQEIHYEHAFIKFMVY